MRHVVGAGHDDHRLGTEVDDVGGEPCQHLGGGLSADAPAAIVVLAEEIGMVEGPVLSDGVPHEHHLGVVAAFCNALIVSPEAVESAPVLLRESEKCHSGKKNDERCFSHSGNFRQR